MAVQAIQKELTIPCHPKYLVEVREMVRQLCLARGLDDKDSLLLSLAVDEAVASMINHAHETNHEGELRVLVDLDDTRFKAVIEDKSNILMADSANEAVYLAHLDRERRHQLSICLMRKIMDEVTYCYKKGFQNDLHLVKFL